MSLTRTKMLEEMLDGAEALAVYSTEVGLSQPNADRLKNWGKKALIIINSALKKVHQANIQKMADEMIAEVKTDNDRADRNMGILKLAFTRENGKCILAVSDPIGRQKVDYIGIAFSVPEDAKETLSGPDRHGWYKIVMEWECDG